MIVAIEGLDSAGKATQARLLADKLRARLFSFPNYETALGQAILGNLKSQWVAADRHERVLSEDARGGKLTETLLRDSPHFNALVLQSLMVVNRYEVAGEIRNAVERGNVVMDRYWLSGVVYGSCDGLDEDWLVKVHQALPQPRAWILLDVSPEESVVRRPERRDRYEKDAHMARRREIYLRLFEDPRRWGGANCFIVNGVGTVEEVHARIFEQLLAKFGSDFGRYVGL